MKPRVRDVDRGYAKLFARALKQDPHVVTVGVQGAEAEEVSPEHGGLSNARLAGVHEFGAEIDTGRGLVKIPERSFIRATIAEHDHYRAFIRRLADRLLVGAFTSVPHALAVLGEKIVSDMRTRIERGIDPPNAASTIARKGSSKPLIDTGQLKNSLTYKVRREGET